MHMHAAEVRKLRQQNLYTETYNLTNSTSIKMYPIKAIKYMYMYALFFFHISYIHIIFTPIYRNQQSRTFKYLKKKTKQIHLTAIYHGHFYYL